MSTDPTEQAPIEPTVLPSIPNPYEVNPYASASLPPLPPPPPRQRRSGKAWIIALVTLTVLVVVGAALSILMYRAERRVNTPAHANVLRTPTSIVTPTVALTSTPDMTATCGTGAGCVGGGQAIPDYTATDILGDFTRAGCPCGYGRTYGETVWAYSGNNYFVSIHATSSATWMDPAQTSGAAEVGVWVYNSQGDAQSAFAQVGTDENSPNNTGSPISEAMKPTEYLHGRCLLLISGYDYNAVPWSGYEQTLDEYCT